MDALLLLGPAGQPAATEAAYAALVTPLATRLGLATTACHLVFREADALAAVDAFLAAGQRQIVVLPLGLEAEEHQHEAIYGGLDWVRAQTPGLTIHYAPIIAAQPPLLTALADRVAAGLTDTQPIGLAETAILLVGRGGYNPDNNAEIARIARLLWEGRPYGWVEAAYYQQATPGIGAGLQRCCQLGAKRIVVAPYWLHLGASQRHIAAQVAAFQTQQPTLPLTVADPLGNHPGVIETIAQQVKRVATGQAPRRLSHSHSHGHTHGSPPAANVASFLPPRYRGGATVSAAPMGAAPLVYDSNGQVAWDQMWGKDDPSTGSGQVPNSPFCELALAGGPPHRGTLLEPVNPADVQADWSGYGRVLAELTRGIQITTGLRTRLSQAPGWIGVECHSEEMAIWLLRAILVENISVRREGTMLYLPAGPSFRLEFEIKNVITALAKTHHYWQEHQHG
ncbi:MAG: CbiX/SirB N-terminal domain-containing protein [Caldilineaceae bacterium]